MLGLQVQGKVTGIQKFLSNVNETNARQTDWARLGKVQDLWALKLLALIALHGYSYNYC